MAHSPVSWLGAGNSSAQEYYPEDYKQLLQAAQLQLAQQFAPSFVGNVTAAPNTNFFGSMGTGEHALTVVVLHPLGAEMEWLPCCRGPH